MVFAVLVPDLSIKVARMSSILSSMELAPLKGNEVDFLGFCRNWFLIDPLHYLSSSSDFGFEFTEIFIFPESESRLLNV
jgi:hypothetical protein